MPLGTAALFSTLESSTIVGVALEDSAELDDEGFARTVAVAVSNLCFCFRWHWI